MSSAADRLFHEVLALPAQEREDLFRRLKEALPHQDADAPEKVSAAWVEVALARLARHDRGETGESKSIDEVESLLADSLREP